MNPKQSRYYTYIRPIYRNKFVRTYSPLIFSLVTIAVFSFYALRPTITTILSLQKSIEEQTEILNKVREKVANLATGKQNYESIDNQVKIKINSLVPDNPALAQLINSLNYIADQTDATISGVQFQTVEITPKQTVLNKDAQILPVDFTLNAQGSFADLMRMLTLMKKSNRLFSITSINFAQPPDAPLIMSISAQAFFIKN